MSQSLSAIWAIASICHQQGITHAVLSPGSRCAPLTLAFVRHPHIQCMTVPDERTAAYIALGMAQQTNRTVALICTSGTAALNYGPAVSEAFYLQVPLLVLTADRPPEWIDQRDGQTIHQRNLYGRHVKKSGEWPAALERVSSRWSGWRQLSELVLLARQHPRGPVHLNVPLYEPLYPEPGETFPLPADLRLIHSPSTVCQLTESAWVPLLAEYEGAETVLLLAGQSPPDPDLSAAVTALANRLGTVVLADILANIPSGEEVCRRAERDPSLWRSAPPTLLITFGLSLLSKGLKQQIRRHPPLYHWHVEAGFGIADPFCSLTRRITAEPALFFNQLTQRIKPRKPSALAESWRCQDRASQRFDQRFFAAQPYSELQAVGQLLAALPPTAHLHLANSLSVRYGALMAPQIQPDGVWANRGTAGIDGCLATAMGHSLVSDRLHLLIIGDMAFHYGRNALWLAQIPDTIRIVLLNNGGGRIFGVIDGPSDQPECASHFIAQQTSSARGAANEAGVDYRTATDHASVQQAIPWLLHGEPGAKLLEIQIDHAISQCCYQAFCRGEEPNNGK
ncbi:MAG: 2-succinyl-5-enolpyruvyl-6-hydroxy-3-cyclohexene-1-carboxylic-acid synthase [Magnetococcales bacterium]|nr:2-succinyl-5-enolpyruvyl-6-hydroxy-3-cyclohexene-1-carboxylic-acid synthase [Magnetococcales bacterium]